MNITHTLAFMIEGDRILLGQHQRGIAKGKWNGFGGKIEPGESIEAAMIREVQEEAGLTPTDYKEMAELHFEFPLDGTLAKWQARVFVVTGWRGEPKPSEEMMPQWFDAPPYGQMWDDDHLWLPRILDDERLWAKFRFDADGKVTDYEISDWGPTGSGE